VNETPEAAAKRHIANLTQLKKQEDKELAARNEAICAMNLDGGLSHGEIGRRLGMSKSNVALIVKLGQRGVT
jgi:DNA-binding NarL/FixJ family response regulator